MIEKERGLIVRVGGGEGGKERRGREDGERY